MSKRRVNKAVQKCTYVNWIFQVTDIILDLKFMNNSTSQEYFRSYYIIHGKHGIGISTLIKMASREVGQGIIYQQTILNICYNYRPKIFSTAMSSSLNQNAQHTQ
ncbi:hypothetical protein Glove_420g112 [Diversispora epigaea]|uniref:Uncharacterized protein n=1 Tax=Diversispora epigaea TaxID=1348612 RepID=A0A397H187_9GLOM|nr:hypothetical protein Glove_420g112 [Diversispora epigaea]